MPKLFEVKKAADSSSEHEEVELASHVINPPRGQYFLLNSVSVSLLLTGRNVFV